MQRDYIKLQDKIHIPNHTFDIKRERIKTKYYHVITNGDRLR